MARKVFRSLASGIASVISGINWYVVKSQCPSRCLFNCLAHELFGDSGGAGVGRESVEDQRGLMRHEVLSRIDAAWFNLWRKEN
jgi:hypothetical protein